MTFFCPCIVHHFIQLFFLTCPIQRCNLQVCLKDQKALHLHRIPIPAIRMGSSFSRFFTHLLRLSPDFSPTFIFPLPFSSSSLKVNLCNGRTPSTFKETFVLLQYFQLQMNLCIHFLTVISISSEGFFCGLAFSLLKSRGNQTLHQCSLACHLLDFRAS